MLTDIPYLLLIMDVILDYVILGMSPHLSWVLRVEMGPWSLPRFLLLNFLFIEILTLKTV